MLLAIDVGNTHTVLGLFQGEELAAHWRLRTDRRQTADELALTVRGLFQLAGRDLAQVRHVVIGSVVPSLQLALAGFCRHHLRLQPVVVAGEPPAGMRIRTAFPAEVGADRVVNALAARERYGRPVVVVDFGTAITFDCVDGQGDYIGGAILPGLTLAVESLAGATAKLPRIDLGGPEAPVIGRDTVSAIRAGILHGYGAMVEGMLARIGQAMTPTPEAVVATGGMASVVAPYAPSLTTIDPHLTLEGLRLYHGYRR